ncbi:MAG: IscS subfamily cysteine desulfurase [Ferrovum myxofaciens]
MSLDLPVYLDYSATTPVDGRVAEKMMPFLTMFYGNPSSNSHSYGWIAEKAVVNAREQVAALLNCQPSEIIWTSGATESNNLSIKGVAHAHKGHGNHLVTMKTEHASVLDSMRQLESEGFHVTYLDPEPNGLLNMDKFCAAIRPETILASVMLVNNEIGVIQDIAAIGEICGEKGVIFHSDAAQATGKLNIDLSALSIDLMSISAHKTYGPKGIGALYVRRKPRVMIEAQIHGGGHERGIRSGTLPTHQIVGMGESFDLMRNEMSSEILRVSVLRDRMLTGFLNIEDTFLNGDLSHRVPHNLNIGFDLVESDLLMHAMKDIAVSSGSACNSGSLEPSHVLRAIGCSKELAQSSIRFSIGRYTTQDEVDFTVQIVKDSVRRLRVQSREVDFWKSERFEIQGVIVA